LWCEAALTTDAPSNQPIACFASVSPGLSGGGGGGGDIVVVDVGCCCS